METNILMSLAWAIIHSIWQGALIFIVVFALLWLTRLQSKNKFYIVFVSMILMQIMFLFNWYYLYDDSESTTYLVPTGIQYMSYFYQIDTTTVKDLTFQFSDFINRNVFLIINFWILGLLVFCLRYFVSYVSLQKLKSGNKTINLMLYGVDMEEMMTRMNVTRQVKVLNFGARQSPFTFGHFKPVIFFPISVLNGLSAQEIECILAHELAHIKRNDYLINIVSCLIESIMYYHPVIWWLKNKMEIYREEACDEEAIKHVGDSLLYAKTLVKLEENLREEAIPSLSMGLLNNKNNFLNRIKKLFNMTYSPINIKEKFIATLILFTMAIGLTEIYAHHVNNKEISFINNVKEEISVLISKPIQIQTDTLPKKKSSGQLIVKTKDNDKEVELKIKDGEVQLLKIDGKEIPPLEYEKHNDIIIKHMPNENRLGMLFDFDHGLKDAFDFKKREYGFDDDMHFPENYHFFKFDSLRQMKFDSIFEKRDFPKLGFNFGNLEKFNFPDVHMFDFNLGRKSYKPDNNGEINLNKKTKDVEFKIYAEGKQLKEGVDYTYDKETGKLKITNEEYKKENKPIVVIPHSNPFYFNFPEDLGNLENLENLENLRDLINDQNFDARKFEFPQFRNFRNDDNTYGEDLSPGMENENLETLIGKQLNRDGFLIAGKKNKIELSGKSLKINGEKQPNNIWNKYKNLAERELGIPLSKDSKLSFEVDGIETKRKYKSF